MSLKTERAAVAAPGPDVFFTICAKNFLAHARALYYSIRPHYPEARFVVALCDRVDGQFAPGDEPFEFVYLDDLALPDFEGMASRYNITEFNTAIKPFVFERLMRCGGCSSIVYLDPDLFFVDRMAELDALLNEGAEAVLTPHILQPAEHDQINDRNMLQFGIYNLGFLALRNTPAVQSFLAWWGRRLERECVIRIEDGLFVDQKWADLLPAFVPGCRVLHHAGYNVAYWNLPQRKVRKTEAGWTVNGVPLRFVHFSGSKLDDPEVFSRHSQQVTVDNIGDLRELLDAYRAEVLEQGHAFYRSLPYAFSWNGIAGVNLHTPAELDGARAVGGATEVSSQGAAHVVMGARSRHFRRVQLLRKALPVARTLAGGWKSLGRRAWRAYRQHGWRHVKQKVVELSRYTAPPASVAVLQVAPSGDGQHRLLYLDWEIPKQDRDAASVTAFNLLEMLSSLGYQVTFLPCSLKYEAGYYEALVQCGVQVLTYPQVESVESWLMRNAADFDLCVLARGPVVWPYLETIRSTAPELKLIFNTVDVHHLREMRQADLAQDAAAMKAALATRDQEFELIEKCNLTIVLSSEEQYLLREKLPEVPLAVLPVVFKDIPGSTRPYADRRDILFIGSFPHQPNIDAVVYFVKEVFPLVRKSIPDVNFKVVGSSPPEEIRRLAEIPGVEILGYVEDIAPVFQSIRLSIAPLRYGAGIKGKIGTSCCYGVPCVATPMAVEGMNMSPGTDVLVGADAEGLAEQIFKAYTDARLWQGLSEACHRFAVDNYSYGVIREKLGRLIRNVESGWRALPSAVELRDWGAYLDHAARTPAEIEARVQKELSLLPADSAGAFVTNGYCAVCNRDARFTTSFMYAPSPQADGKTMPNWREHMQCEHCGLVNRVRATLQLLHTVAEPHQTSCMYITERLTRTYQWLAERFPQIIGSEYFAGAKPGALVNGVRNEDVMRLSFADASFDHIMSLDVLEHVPDPDQAFQEIHRVLRPGGTFIFSVPFAADREDDVIRAVLHDDGTVEHLMEPEFHGNPVDPEGGALCYRYFGWSVLDRLREMGFGKAVAVAYWSERQGYLGREQYLFYAIKGDPK